MRFIKNKIFLFTTLVILSMTGCSLQPRTEEIIADTLNVIHSSELEETVNLDKFEDEITDVLVDTASELATEDLLDKVVEEPFFEENLEEDTISSDFETSEFETASLVRVVDGDTIVVSINQEEYKVRMIGIDTPESVASKAYLEKTGKENTEEGIKASDYTKLLLEGVDTVYLQKDKSDTDRYGRLLRYVWISVPEDEYNTQEVAEKMVNGMLLAEKVAEPASYKPDTSYADIFEDIYMNY